MEVEKLKKEYDLRVEWHPFFLRPETPPEGLSLPAYVRERQKDPNNPLKRRAAAAGLTMVDREIIPSTRRAHEAAEFARETGKIDPFHAALLRRYWSEGQSVWEWETLRGAAQEAGVDPEAMQRAVEEGRYRAAVEDAVREAHELGINAVPTFLIGNRVAMQGAQEYAAFKQAMEQLAAKPHSSPGAG